jgi:membrane-associated protein
MIKPSLLLDVIWWLEWVIIYLWWKNYLLMWGVWFIESIPFLNIAFPGQTFMILIAWFVAQKAFLLAMLIVVFACTLWDMVAYLVGRYKGNSILRHYWPTFGITPEYVDKIKEMTHEHAHRALFASKWNSYTRWMVPFIAWTSHMKFWDFMFYNILGSIVYWWVLVYLAKLFIWHYDKVVPYVRWIWLWVVWIVAIWYIIKYRKKHGKTR